MFVSSTSPSVAGLDMSGVVFWLICPVLVLALVLALVALVALFRAPRAEATIILAVFAAALARLGDRLPRPGQYRIDRVGRAHRPRQGEQSEAE